MTGFAPGLALKQRRKANSKIANALHGFISVLNVKFTRFAQIVIAICFNLSDRSNLLSTFLSISDTHLSINFK